MGLPTQLKNTEMRFTLVEENEKKPLGLAWNDPNNKHYTYEEIEEKLAKEPTKNFGLLCGAGNYLVVDIDRHNEDTFQALTEKAKHLPPTFTTQTPTGGIHLYYRILDPENAKFVNLKHEGKDAGEIRWLSSKKTYTQVLCPGSKIKGKEYKIIIDEPIAEVKWHEIFTLLSPFSSEVQQTINENTENTQTIDVKIREVYDYTHMRKYGDEYYGAHPTHGSETGKNFWINEEKNTWYCFRHHVGGSAIQLYAIINGFATCETLRELKGAKFVECMKSLEQKLGKKLLQTNELRTRLYRALEIRNIASDIVKELGIHYDANGIWWLWNPELTKYEIVDDTEIMNAIDASIKFDESTLTAHVKNTILEGLKREGRKNKPKQLTKFHIQFKSTIINIETGEKLPASPEHFVTNPIPWEIGESEETPVIDRFFEEWVGEKKDVLYEIIAFSMCPSYFINRIVCLTGSGGNGKSSYLTLLRTAIGASNTTSSELDFLITNRFETSKLYKKLVCFMGETNFATIKKTSLLKKLTGNDLISCEFKNKNSFDFVNYAKIIIATNTLPESMDKTDGFYRRWLIIDFENRFEENGRLLETIPEYEYSNLAKKSINILRRLIKENKFTGEQGIEERRKAYESHSNPLKDFIKANYVISPNLSIPFYEFYDRYTNYLESKGMRNITKKELGEMLENIGYETQKRHYTKTDGRDSTMYYIYGFGRGDFIA